MPRSREWYDPELHLPFGEVAVFQNTSGNPFLTNAKPERVSTSKAKLEGIVKVRLDGTIFVPEGDPIVPWALQACGFDSRGEVARKKPDSKIVEGKFVFHKDGTFFLAMSSIMHVDLPESISVYDPVALLSAGFITLTSMGVDLHGTSIGLRKGPYYGTPYDRQYISSYFNLPFATTEDEFL